jgi:MFS family permease
MANQKGLQTGQHGNAMSVGGRAGSLRNVRTFESFKSLGFRFYFLGMVGQWGSMNMQITAQSLLIYRLTGSPAILGFMALATALPTVVLSLFGGAIADRMRKKHLIQVGQAAAALTTLGTAIALSTGYLAVQHIGSWWVLIATSVVQGIAGAFVMPSRQAIIPELVSKERVLNAVSLNIMGQNTFQLVSPAIAGFAIDAFGFEAVYFIMTGLYIMAIIFTAFIPAARTTYASRSNTLVDVREGLKYIWANSTIFFLIIIGTVFLLFSSPIQMLMPIFADDILKVGASGMGVLMSASGAGALVASLIMASLPNRRQGKILFAGLVVQSLALAAFAFSRSWPLSIGLMVLIGVAQTSHRTMAFSLLQTHSDPRYIGRVMSATTVNGGFTSLGTFFAGMLAESIGAVWAIGGFAMFLVLLSTLAAFLLVGIRRLE